MTIMHKLLALHITIACFLTVTSPAQAAMYKWVDEKGDVHYTQTPPPDRSAESIKEHTPPPPPPQIMKPFMDNKDNANPAALPPGEAAERKAERDAIYKKNCETARRNLGIYQRASRMRGEDGTPYNVTDEERAEKIGKAKDNIKKYCH